MTTYIVIISSFSHIFWMNKSFRRSLQTRALTCTDHLFSSRDCLQHMYKCIWDPFTSSHPPGFCIIRELPTTTLSTDSGPWNTRRMANDRTSMRTTTRNPPTIAAITDATIYPLSTNSTCSGWRIDALRCLHYYSPSASGKVNFELHTLTRKRKIWLTMLTALCLIISIEKIEIF